MSGGEGGKMSAFRIGEKNQSRVIRDLQHINGNPINIIEQRMRAPSGATPFLMPEQSLLDVMARDNDTVLAKGLTHQELATHLRNMVGLALEKSKELSRKNSSGKVEPYISIKGDVIEEYQGEQYRLYYQPWMGGPESPFGDKDRSSCFDLGIQRLRDNETMVFSELHPFMMEQYGFYEGGTDFNPSDTAFMNTLIRLTKEAGEKVIRESIEGDCFGDLTRENVVYSLANDEYYDSYPLAFFVDPASYPSFRLGWQEGGIYDLKKLESLIWAQVRTHFFPSYRLDPARMIELFNLAV